MCSSSAVATQVLNVFQPSTPVFQIILIQKVSVSSLKSCWHEGENKKTGTSAPMRAGSGEARTVTWVLRLMENQPHSLPNCRRGAWPALVQLCLKWEPGGPSWWDLPHHVLLLPFPVVTPCWSDGCSEANSSMSLPAFPHPPRQELGKIQTSL